MGCPTLPRDVFTWGSAAEAPRVDSCRPRGIRFDRSLCPPDDEVTDALCALAAAVSNARIECGLDVVVGGGEQVDGSGRVVSPRRGRSLDVRNDCPPPTFLGDAPDPPSGAVSPEPGTPPPMADGRGGVPVGCGRVIGPGHVTTHGGCCG